MSEILPLNFTTVWNINDTVNWTCMTLWGRPSKSYSHLHVGEGWKQTDTSFPTEWHAGLEELIQLGMSVWPTGAVVLALLALGVIALGVIVFLINTLGAWSGLGSGLRSWACASWALILCWAWWVILSCLAGFRVRGVLDGYWFSCTRWVYLIFHGRRKRPWPPVPGTRGC